MIWAVAKMIFGLGMVLLLLCLFVRLLRRASLMKGAASSDSDIRVLTSRPVGPRKYISLVEIGGEVLALGISDSQITLLTKIEDRAVAERMMARARSSDSFSLRQLLPGKRGEAGLGLLRTAHGK